MFKLNDNLIKHFSLSDSILECSKHNYSTLNRQLYQTAIVNKIYLKTICGSFRDTF